MKHLALGVMILHYESTSECAGLEQKIRYGLGTLKYSVDAKCDPTTTCRRERREKILIVGSLSGSRQKSVRFLVGESSVPVASSVPVQTIKINH
jgi:hypothetical protein